MKGWIYTIHNKSIPDLIRVETSMVDPNTAINELNLDTLPSSYEIGLEALVADVEWTLEYLSKKLKEYRVSELWYNCNTAQITAVLATFPENVISNSCAKKWMSSNFTDNEIKQRVAAINSDYHREFNKIYHSLGSSLSLFIILFVLLAIPISYFITTDIKTVIGSSVF